MKSVWEFGFPDSLVLVCPDSPGLYILNASAAYAWRLLQAGTALPDAIADFAGHFQISADRAAQDLQRTWSEWQQTILAPLPPSPPVSLPLSPPAFRPGADFSRIYRVHGKNIRIVLQDPDLIAEIVPRLEAIRVSPASNPDITLQATASESGYHIFSESAYVSTEHHPADLRVAFLQQLVRTAQADRPWAAILHAGACGSETKCIIFPAATHSGKTTLAAVLMHSGLTMYADDSVALECEDFGVPAMPFSLMIREGSWHVASERFFGFQNLPIYERYGQKVKFLHPTHPPCERSAHVTAMVFSQWQPGSATKHSALDPLEALVRLNETGFWVVHERNSIRKFLEWLQGLPIYELIYSDVDEAATFVRELLAS